MKIFSTKKTILLFGLFVTMQGAFAAMASVSNADETNLTGYVQIKNDTLVDVQATIQRFDLDNNKFPEVVRARQQKPVKKTVKANSVSPKYDAQGYQFIETTVTYNGVMLPQSGSVIGVGTQYHKIACYHVKSADNDIQITMEIIEGPC